MECNFAELVDLLNSDRVLIRDSFVFVFLFFLTVYLYDENIV